MANYYFPEDIAISTGSSEATLAEFIGRDVVAFGRNGFFPGRKNIDWSWDKDTGIMSLLQPGDIFDGSSFHFQFSVKLDASNDCGRSIQYPHILRYDISSWSTDTGSITHVERRCRIEYNSKSSITFNGIVAKAIVYLPFPEIKIQENIPVTIYDCDSKVFESGTVLQYRKGLLNQRLWL